MLIRKAYLGFSVIELMITLSIIGILAVIAVPSYVSFQQRSLLTGSVEKVFSHMEYARSESIASGKDILVVFESTSGADWCVGVSELAGCGCSTGASLAACTINGVPARFVRGSDYPSIQVTTDFPDNDTEYLAPRSVASESGSITVALPGYGDAEVRLNRLGRLRLCSDSLSIYAGCP